MWSLFLTLWSPSGEPPFLAVNPLPRGIRNMAFEVQLCWWLSPPCFRVCVSFLTLVLFSKGISAGYRVGYRTLTGGPFCSLRKSFYWILPVNSVTRYLLSSLFLFFLWLLIRFLSSFWFEKCDGHIPWAVSFLLLSSVLLGSLDLWAISIKSGHISAVTSANIFLTLFLIFPSEIPVTGV